MTINPQTPDPTPESARALLYRHGLPEDIIDGALCLHAQELAAAIRNHPGAIPYRPQLDEDGGFWWDLRDRDAAADLIDPTRADNLAVLPAVPVPPATHATDEERRDRIAAAMREHYLCTDRGEADADGNSPCRCGDWRESGPMGSEEEDWDSHMADVALAELHRMADEAQQQKPDTEVLAAALDGLHTLIATSSRDWQTYRVDAWIWAVLCGWDCEQAEHDETCTHGALEETAAMHGWDDATVAKARRYRTAVRALTTPAASGPGRVADEEQSEAPDVDPVYDPRAWETYRRDVGCGCTAPAPVDCKVPHGTGAWLCVCHRLSGPPMKETDPPGTFLSSEDEAIRRHFQEPNRCLSVHAGIFRCSRPTGHLGDHRMARTFWGRRAEDDEPAAVAQPEIVHACPPDGSGLTPCCGRTPFELPLGDRISSEAPITCQGSDHA